jgi:riboflavin synthase
MFTGIVAAVGRIERVTPQADRAGGVELTIDAGSLELSDVQIGDSIAINGACMTVTRLGAGSFQVDVSRESLDCTCGLAAIGEVNLEKALRLGDALGGHLVAGHVDGVGQVVGLTPHAESSELVIRASRDLAPLISTKGSITVNGVSLTINRVTDFADACEFSINLIPHTLAATTLRHLVAGAPVNLEADLLARYLARMLAARAIPPPA